jgi:hypothetical protein
LRISKIFGAPLAAVLSVALAAEGAPKRLISASIKLDAFKKSLRDGAQRGISVLRFIAIYSFLLGQHSIFALDLSCAVRTTPVSENAEKGSVLGPSKVKRDYQNINQVPADERIREFDQIGELVLKAA